MEKFFENMDYKKSTVVLGFVAIFLILFLATLFIMATGSRQRPVQSQDTEVIKAPTAIPTTNQNAAEHLFSNNFIEFYYPAKWNAHEAGVVGGGTGIILEPKSVNPQNARVEIQISKTSRDIPDQIFTLLQYKKSTVILNGTTATKFVGSSLGKNNRKEFTTAIIFTKNENTFFIRESYSASVADSQIERDFLTIEESIKPK